jgi:hypothetical protein
MAAPYNPPVKGEEFIFTIALEDASTPGSFKRNPTIAAGDFKVNVDGTESNLATLPAVWAGSPNEGIAVKVTLSASEMNGDVVTLIGIDQTSTKEWNDVAICIPTTSA